MKKMILTIVLDPILEKEYYVDRLYPKIETLATKISYDLGGKGNVLTKILNNLNLDVFSIGFLGGLNGVYIFDQLKIRGIYNDFISIKDDSRGAMYLFEDGQLISTIIEPGPRIIRDELVSFYELYGRVIERHEIICGLGSLPMGVPKEIYYELIDLANRKDKKFILDAEGLELTYGIEALPFMVKLNKNDLEEISKLKLNFENEIIKIGYSILEKGIEIVVIDLNEDGTIVLTKDRGYRLELFEMDIRDIGEDKGYIVSGYAFGIERQYDLETTMRLSQAMRIVYGFERNLDKVDMSDIKKIMGKIEISPIYY